MSKFYVLSIGGSGALATESLVHLCAIGLGPEEITIGIIDADETNSNVIRLQDTINSYVDVRSQMKEKFSEYFKTKITYSQEYFWNPNSGDKKNLDDAISYTQLNNENSIKYKYLTDLLFSEDQRREKLDQGYKGNPMIGTIFMNDVENSVFFKAMKDDPEVNLFVFGSLFGGTGAAGLPVMGKALKKMRAGRRTITGTCITLPYFSISSPTDDKLKDFERKEITILPDAKNFLAAVKFALPSYIKKINNTRDNGYNSIYFIGCYDSFIKSQRNFAIGSTEQKNKSHYINLFSATSFLNFMNKCEDIEPSSDTRFHGMSAKFDNELGYNNFPKDLAEDINHKLESFYISSIFYKKYFMGKGKSNINKITWFSDKKSGLGLGTDFYQKKFAGLFNKYVQLYLVWLGQISINEVPMKVFTTVYYDPQNDTINLDDNNYPDDQIGKYFVEDRNPEFGFFSKPKKIDELNNYFSDVDMKNYDRNHVEKNFLDCLKNGSDIFISKYYLKNKN